ncbi:DNA adenine methylase [Salinibacter ruber]|uniref:DNA adenine methylase n=1 Tax=Salinibacter ruber TaxID=146919 RepID=UPI002168311D|nr:DNA adenine methylase [Salinibacter ruber]MCS3863015.1 DNA adenine methylase [Salinibacter ruber]
MQYSSPLRYPGGKSRLSDFMRLICTKNGLVGGEYVEPYAGGAGVALFLLYYESVRRIHINDIDRSIWAFWESAVNNTERLCELIRDRPVTTDEWKRQKAVHEKKDDASVLELGFSTFFLNRTNRSGILSAGMIGGEDQSGSWKIDARYNKEGLIRRIMKVGRFSDRIEVYNRDAVDLIGRIERDIPSKSIFYLDPPYFKESDRLYENSYDFDDHKEVSDKVRSIDKSWIVSYDNEAEIKNLYEGAKSIEYSLSYSAQKKYKGSEIMFFSDNIKVPEVDSPIRVDDSKVSKQLSFPR